MELTLQGGRSLRLHLLLSEEERQSLDALLAKNEAYLSAGQQLPLQEEVLSLRCDQLGQGHAAELWQTLRQELSDLPAAAPTQAQNLSLYDTAQAGSERALGPFLLYRQSSLRPLGRLSLEGYAAWISSAPAMPSASKPPAAPSNTWSFALRKTRWLSNRSAKPCPRA